jgi:hypothetical protein
MYRIGFIISNTHLFSNGMIQNAVFFYQVYSNLGNKCTLLSYDKSYKQLKGLESIPIETISISSSEFQTSDYDVLVTVGQGISPDVYASCKRTNTLVIGFTCGNILASTASGFIQKDASSSSALIGKEAPVDVIWMIEGYRYMKSFMEVARDVPVKLVQHVWSPKLLEAFGASRKRDSLCYKHEHKPDSKYNILILEPNIAFTKTAVIPFTICERLNKQAPDRINQVYIFNWNEGSKTAQHLVRNFEVSKKTRFFKSMLIDEILHHFNSQPHPFIVLSHQINNPWNYLYYEMWHFGVPLVHNSPEFKHLGYYYSDCDVEHGAKAVLNAAQYHGQLHAVQKPKIETLLESMEPAASPCMTYWKELLDAELFTATQRRICGGAGAGKSIQ